jgi:hypothetical protein
MNFSLFFPGLSNWVTNSAMSVPSKWNSKKSYNNLDLNKKIDQTDNWAGSIKLQICI